MKKNSFVGWLASHVMLALVVLSQVVFPSYYLKADCVEGTGSNGYDYNPRSYWIDNSGVHYVNNDYTASNVTLDGSYTDMGNDNWIGAFTGHTESPDGSYIALNLFNDMLTPQSGSIQIYTKDSTYGAWNLFSTTPFTNTYSLGATIQIPRYGACRAGYKIKFSVSGMAQEAFVQRIKNN